MQSLSPSCLRILRRNYVKLSSPPRLMVPRRHPLPKEKQKEVKKLLRRRAQVNVICPTSFSGERARTLLQGAYQEVSKVQKLKINQANIYYIRNKIMQDAETVLHALPKEEQDLPYKQRQQEEILNMLEDNQSAIDEAYTTISKAREFMDKIQSMIDSLSDYGVV